MSQKIPVAESPTRLDSANSAENGIPVASSPKPGRGKVSLVVLAALGLYLGFTPLTVLAGNLAGSFYKPQAATAILSLVLTANPDNTEALIGRSDSYRAEGKYEPALADLSHILDRNPHLSTVRARRADLYQIAGHDSLAKSDLQILHNESPETALFFQRRAFMAVYGQAKPEEIIRLSTCALAIDPTLAKSYANRAQGYIRRGEYEKAIADASAGLALKPTLDSTINTLYARRAQAYYSLDRISDAIADARAAIAAEGTLRSYINMALYCKETGRYNLALSTIKEGLRKVDRIDMVLLYLKRKIYIETGDPRIDYTLEPAGFPKQKLTEFFLDKADLYLEGKNYQHALSSLAQAVEIKPQKLTVIMARARINLAMGKNKEALAELNTCVNLRPKLADAYYFRALAEGNLGQAGAALSDLAMAKQLGFVEDGQYKHLLQDYMP